MALIRLKFVEYFFISVLFAVVITHCVCEINRSYDIGFENVHHRVNGKNSTRGGGYNHTRPGGKHQHVDATTPPNGRHNKLQPTLPTYSHRKNRTVATLPPRKSQPPTRPSHPPKPRPPNTPRPAKPKSPTRPPPTRPPRTHPPPRPTKSPTRPPLNTPKHPPTRPRPSPPNPTRQPKHPPTRPPSTRPPRTHPPPRPTKSPTRPPLNTPKPPPTRPRPSPPNPTRSPKHPPTRPPPTRAPHTHPPPRPTKPPTLPPLNAPKPPSTKPQPFPPNSTYPLTKLPLTKLNTTLPPKPHPPTKQPPTNPFLPRQPPNNIVLNMSRPIIHFDQTKPQGSSEWDDFTLFLKHLKNITSNAKQRDKPKPIQDKKGNTIEQLYVVRDYYQNSEGFSKNISVKNSRLRACPEETTQRWCVPNTQAMCLSNGDTMCIAYMKDTVLCGNNSCVISTFPCSSVRRSQHLCDGQNEVYIYMPCVSKVTILPTPTDDFFKNITATTIDLCAVSVVELKKLTSPVGAIANLFLEFGNSHLNTIKNYTYGKNYI